MRLKLGSCACELNSGASWDSEIEIWDEIYSLRVIGYDVTCCEDFIIVRKTGFCWKWFAKKDIRALRCRFWLYHRQLLLKGLGEDIHGFVRVLGKLSSWLIVFLVLDFFTSKIGYILCGIRLRKYCVEGNIMPQRILKTDLNIFPSIKHGAASYFICRLFKLPVYYLSIGNIASKLASAYLCEVGVYHSR